ncbi:autophagy 8 [Neocallimastix lanati (nom. inval.)]|nr:autophagy 8 [Neocallimastix sp. JGI-2020a]
MQKRFRDSHSFEERKNKVKKLREKYKDKIPCIVEKAKSSKIPDIECNKILIDHSKTVGQLMCTIRKKIKLPSEDAIFLFINGILPPVANTMSTIYEKYKDEDGFLYVTYSGETTFGSN